MEEEGETGLKFEQSNRSKTCLPYFCKMLKQDWDLHIKLPPSILSQWNEVKKKLAPENSLKFEIIDRL